MKGPRKFDTWKTWRHYHRTVWRVALRRFWISPLLLITYSVQVIFWGGDIELATHLILWFCALFIAVSWGLGLGRLYEDFDQALRMQVIWHRTMQEIRAKMIEDGIAPEEADTALWAMDLEIERHMRGRPDPS